MIFEWDPEKNEKNIKKHGFDFRDSELIFAGFTTTPKRDNRKEYGEFRWLIIGDDSGVPVVVCYTERESKVRIISIRKADKDEREEYQKQKR